jgi:hypothetical protein
MIVIAQNCYFSANQKAKRLHGASIGLSSMYSPRFIGYPIQMNKKNNKSVSGGRKTPQKNAPKTKKTPFSDAGAIVGSRLGTMFNAPYLKGVGKWLGSGVGSIFGSGDYTIMGSQPNYNVLMNGNQIPQFKTSNATNIICHREYLGDITGTAGFSNNVYPLNPGVSTTFPWLSSIAENYQQYRIHGLIFEFRPLITDFVTGGAPGVVVMATNYNADAIPYNTKQEMENSEYAVSVKPTMSLMHGVECAGGQTVLSQLYVRTGSPAANLDLKFTDLGNFQLATQANPPGANLGELWVSYCVEFFKPILPQDVGGNILTAKIYRGTVVAASDPLGSALLNAKGDLQATSTGKSITFKGQPGNYYYVQVAWAGSAAAIIGVPIFTPSANLVQANFFKAGAVSSIQSPSNGVLSVTSQICVIYQFVGQSPDFGTLSLGLAGTLPTGITDCDILITGISTESV